MSILIKIAALRDDLTPAEQAIADIVLADPERVMTLSSVALGQVAGRSQSGVVKLCQKLGFRGYQDFRLAVGQACAQGWTLPDGPIHGSIGAADPYAVVVQKLLGAKVVAIRQTMEVNDEAVLTHALSRIEEARRIQLCGVGASSLVARDFSYKLQKLGRPVLYDADSHIQMAHASSLGPEDLLIVMSYSGQSLETLSAAQTAKTRGAPVLSITGLQENRLAEIADLRLNLVADESSARSSAILTRDAQLALTDTLFLMLTQRQSDASARIQAAEQATARLKT